MRNPDKQLSQALAGLSHSAGRAHLVLSEVCVEIFLGGEIDIAIRDVLDRIVSCATELGGPVIVDSSAVTFADSTLVHMLGAFPDRTALTLRHPEPMITDLLALAGIQLPTAEEGDVAPNSAQLPAVEPPPVSLVVAGRP
jgi:anti-anti-sigma regulatory factor